MSVIWVPQRRHRRRCRYISPRNGGSSSFETSFEHWCSSALEGRSVPLATTPFVLLVFVGPFVPADRIWETPSLLRRTVFPARGLGRIAGLLLGVVVVIWEVVLGPIKVGVIWRGIVPVIRGIVRYIFVFVCYKNNKSVGRLNKIKKIKNPAFVSYLLLNVGIL